MSNIAESRYKKPNRLAFDIDMSRAANALDKKVTHPSRLLPHFQHSSLVLSTVTGPGMTNAAPLVTNFVDRLCANLDRVDREQNT